MVTHFLMRYHADNDKPEDLLLGRPMVYYNATIQAIGDIAPGLVNP